MDQPGAEQLKSPLSSTIEEERSEATPTRITEGDDDHPTQTQDCATPATHLLQMHRPINAGFGFSTAAKA